MKNFLIVILCLLCSCSTLNNDKNSYHFPPDIKAVANTELQNAKSCIESKGLKLKDKGVDLKIVKVDGTRKVDGEWMFVNPYVPNQIIYGFIDYSNRNSTYYIHVACNPKTKNEISTKTLKHEFGHFWLMSNKDDWTHNPIYKNCFVGWISSKSLTNNIIGSNEYNCIIHHHKLNKQSK